MALAALSTAACAPSDSTGARASASTPRPLQTPLSTSVDTTAGTWATLPMGHLDDPLNTFWQLFFRPANSSSWSDQVEATAVATNGGLVLAPSAGRSLTVGIRPSNLLTFSPLITTANAGRSWSNGLIPDGLAASPDALASSPSGQALALVGTGASTQILTGTQLSDWHTLATQKALTSSPAGQACAPTSLNAVAYQGADPVVAGTCARAGTVGIFVERAGRWQLSGLDLPAPLAGDTVQVLALGATAGDLAGLLALSSVGNGTALAAAWIGNSGSGGNVSAPLALLAGERVISEGAVTGGGWFALLASASGAARLETVAGPNGRWKALPAPPAGTATVTFDSPSGADALVADNTVLTVWTLRPGATAWTKGQVIQVPIEFVSSS